LNPVTAHTASKISDFTARDRARYRTACAFVIAFRATNVSSIQPGRDRQTTAHQRRHAAQPDLFR